MEKRKKVKNNKKKIILIIIVVLAVLNLFILIIRPDLPLKLLGGSESDNIDRKIQGKGKACLILSEHDRTFDGNGFFNPMDGVQALDIDGSDISRKVAVSYLSGKTISDKEIHYTVFDSEARKMEESCRLTLEGYTGPSIWAGEIGSVTWEELQRLPAELIFQDLLKADDGFGNDISGAVSHSYELIPELQEAEVTLSLMNDFQDYQSTTIRVTVEGIPEELEVIE